MMPSNKPTKREFGHAVPKPTLEQLASLRNRMQRTSADFLKVDVETALTFTSSAMNAESARKKDRNRKAARRAYDTVVRLAKKVDLTDAEAHTLDRGLKKLKEDLRALGEAV